MNNLRKFNNEAEYSAATLNYPAVSWVVSGDTIHYDLSGDTPTPPSQCIPSSTSIWYQSMAPISSSTPIYEMDVYDKYNSSEGGIVLSTTPNGNVEYNCEVQVDSDPESPGEAIYTLSLYDNNNNLIDQTVNEPLNLCTILGFPLYVINDSVYYEVCMMSECISWCADEECSDCTDEEGEYGCCEEECTDTIQTYVMCYTIEDNS